MWDRESHECALLYSAHHLGNLCLQKIGTHIAKIERIVWGYSEHKMAKKTKAKNMQVCKSLSIGLQVHGPAV